MYKKIGRSMILYLEQELDHHYAAKIVEETNQVMEKYPIKHILFDFHKVHFMDSSGIGMLMGRYKMVGYTGGSIGVTGVSDHVERIFRLSGLYKWIQPYKSENEALEAFGDKEGMV